MIEWFARNGVAANLLMALLIGIGVVSLMSKVNKEVFPTVEPDSVYVTVQYPGSTPAETEEAIVLKIEEAIQDLAGIERIYSNANEGSASVRVEVTSGYDPRQMLEDLKNRVDSINTFPIEAERPNIYAPQRQDRVSSVILTADMSERDLKELGQRVRDEIANLPKVTTVYLAGVRPYQVSVEISEATLRKYGLTLGEVAQKIRESSLDLSAGRIRSKNGDILLRTEGQAYSKADFDKIVLRSNPDGTRLRLSDIADVDDGFEEDPFFTRFNEKRAVLIDVVRVGNQDAIEIADAVMGYVEKIESRLPPGVDILVWQDRSEVIAQRLDLLLRNALQGGFLVLLTLSLFLRPSLAFWVALGIPVSFMASLAILPYLGVTINLISLFAYILVLGIVVDDAIVTGENVFSRMQKGEPALTAAIKGTREVSIPVTFGVLTTMLAFVPLTMIEGRRGAIFSNITAVVIPVLFFSLIESKLVLPCHLSHLKNVGKGHREKLGWLMRGQRAVADGLERFVEKVYQPLLDIALRNRYATVCGFIAIFLATVGILAGGHLRFVFFPNVPNDSISVRLTMPVGTPKEITAMHLETLKNTAEGIRDEFNAEYGEDTIRSIVSTVGGHPFGSGWGRGGGGYSHRAEVVMELAPAEIRNEAVDSVSVAQQWRKAVGMIPGAEEVSFNYSFGRGGAVVDVELTGPDLDELSEIADRIKERLLEYPGLFDITDSFQSGKDELQISLKPEGEFLGISVNDIARQVRQAFFGAEAQRIQRGSDDIRVMVRYPEDERRSEVDLRRMYIRAPDGTEVPFEEVAHAEMGKSLPSITRIDRNRTISVSADADFAVADVEAIRRDLEEGFLPALLSNYPTVNFSMEGEAREQRESMAGLYMGVMLVLCGIYGMLAIAFRSYFQPFIVMSAIPFGFVGAVIGHYVMGYANGLGEPYNLSILSYFGILALSGVVVNDSLVMVDFINQRRREGIPSSVAVLTSGASRFRPILLTSLTTVAGLAPLLFEKSRQAQFLIPMAISLAWGVLFATAITLLLVPSLYLIFEDAAKELRRFGWWFSGHFSNEEPEPVAVETVNMEHDLK